MVKSLSQTDKQKIASAITEAEKTTSAEIVLVVSGISDAYQSYILLIALAIGSLLAGMLLTANLITSLPYLLLIQLTIIALFPFIPPIRNLCIYFVPRKILYHRAAHRAYEEYINISHNIPATVPIVIFYISLAERYAHILSDRLVREKIPDGIWDSAIDEFTKTVTAKGLTDACIEAIQHITNQLAPYFPAENNRNYLSNEVITAI